MTRRILRLLDRLLCRVGAHRWTHPGGTCENCGIRDTFFDERAQ